MTALGWRSPVAILAASVTILVTQIAVAPSANAGVVFLSSVYSWDGGTFDDPLGLTSDDVRDVFVADSHNHRIVELTSTGHYVRAFGRGSPETAGTNGHLYYPGDLVWSDGKIYVADTSAADVQVFTDEGAFVSRWAKEGQFAAPMGIAADCAGNIYVTDSRKQNIQKFSKDGVLLKQFGLGKLDVPVGIAVASVTATECLDTDIFVADEYSNRIAHFTTGGTFVGYIGGPGTEKGQFRGPDQIALQRNPNTTNLELWVAESGNFRVQQLVSADDGSTWQPHVMILSGDKGLNAPHGVTVDRAGRIVVANTGEGALFWYKQAPLRMHFKLDGERRDIKEDDALYVNVRHNQQDETCRLTITIKTTVPPHAAHEFALDTTVTVGTDAQLAVVRPSERQMRWIKEAWRDDRRVLFEAKGVGKCTGGQSVRETDTRRL